MNIKLLSRAVLIILWLSTFAAATVWAFMKDPPFDPEPVTVLLGLISTAITGLLTEYSNRLEKEEYSVSFALAYGYVNNFLEPVITHFAGSGTDPKIFIFIPEDLAELEARSTERIMGLIRKRFTSEVVKIDLKEGRARDIISIFQDPSEKMIFDFPTTLLTLNSLIDYKLETKSGSFPTEAKKQMGQLYISKFSEALRKLLQEKDIEGYVTFTDKQLAF